MFLVNQVPKFHSYINVSMNPTSALDSLLLLLQGSNPSTLLNLPLIYNVLKNCDSRLARCLRIGQCLRAHFLVILVWFFPNIGRLDYFSHWWFDLYGRATSYSPMAG